MITEAKICLNDRTLVEGIYLSIYSVNRRTKVPVAVSLHHRTLYDRHHQVNENYKFSVYCQQMLECLVMLSSLLSPDIILFLLLSLLFLPPFVQWVRLHVLSKVDALLKIFCLNILRLRFVGTPRNLVESAFD